MTKAITLILAVGILGFSLLDPTLYTMKNINDFLKDQVNNGNTPSIQYAFFDTESIIFELRYGLKDVKSKVPVDALTTYHLYSITKTFTALAVLQLAQERKVVLTEPVITYLPEFPYHRDVTVVQLLSHTAGIPNPMPLEWIHTAERHSAFKRDAFFVGVFKAHPRLDFLPGTEFKYSNLGYVILGQLVERISGLPFEDYVQANIIDRSGVVPGDLSFQMEVDRHAVGYQKWWSLGHAALGFLIDKEMFMGPREGRWKPFRHFYNNGTAYGGMFGNRAGLIRYAQALLDDNSLLLHGQYKKQLFTESVIHGKPTGMALSWFTGSLKGNRYLAHAGGGGGYYVELRLYPDLGVGSVIMYNRSGMRDERMLDRADQFFVSEGSGSAVDARF